MKLIAAVLLTTVAFAYAAGVGYLRWPPFSTLQAAAQTTRWRAPDPGKSAYYEARTALLREIKVMPDIVMLGDSLTEWGNWHELMPQHHIINRGIAGDTSSSVLDRLDEVMQRQPKVVFVMVGTNDVGLQVPPGGLLGNLQAIVTRQREAGITPVAQSILFRGGSLNADNATIAAVNAAWAAFCSAEGMRFLDLNARMAVDGRLPEAMTYDGVHLPAAAYRVWRDEVARVLAEILWRDSAVRLL